jgi:non-specific serine/threonine protein kinase/serine/threonine-protein kinase
LTPDRWQRVKEVFSIASGLADAERDAYFADACLNDPELQSEVESLLRAHAQENAFIDRPAAAQLAGDPAPTGDDRWLGRRIGPYEIVSLIARGGMGEVYRARRIDAAYEKEVAIKLVPGGSHASFVLHRLHAERQILADLEHPNIARLLDGGATEDGSPYLVMELVDGKPIDEHVEERGLPVRIRLDLFREVCAAVSYAHQRLVVHRDLKPGNILVTADGKVKLLDFGIAKLLQPAEPGPGPMPTRTMMQVLTPGFASPEQVLGKPITTSSDVYSLGVVLYLLLTGRSPYRSTLETAESAIREICDTDPVPPSAAASTSAGQSRERLGSDLDAIILRALRKEPDRRYVSVDQFSEDIRRHLDGLPVLARGDRFSYRAGKFLRRHKLEMTAAGLLAATLVGATIFSLREARIAALERERAERHFANVRGLANAFMFQVHDAIKELPGSIEARDLLVSTALEYLDSLSDEAGNDDKLRIELATAYQKIADIQGGPNRASKGQVKAAADSYARSIDLLGPVVAGDPDNLSARAVLAESYQRRSRLLVYLSEFEEAVASSAQAIAMFESLVEPQPDPATRMALARAYRRHTDNLRMAGRSSGDGLGYARKALETLEELAAQRPDDLELSRELAQAYGDVGDALLGPVRQQQALDECLSMYRRALAIDQRLVAATESRNMAFVRALLYDRVILSDLLTESGDHVTALENARSAQELLAILEADASNAQALLDGAVVANRLGQSLLAVGNLHEAMAVFERNLQVLDRMARETGLPSLFLRGVAEQGLGAIHSRLASEARLKPAAKLDHLQRALGWYGKAVTHIEGGMPVESLDFNGRRLYDAAVAGVARSKAEIKGLAVAAPSS